jgi:hypothetical protein
MRSLCSALGYLPSAPLAGRRNSPAATAAVTSALSELGLPYVFGQRARSLRLLGPAAWANGGHTLSRTTYAQIHEGTPTRRPNSPPGTSC